MHLVGSSQSWLQYFAASVPAAVFRTRVGNCPSWACGFVTPLRWRIFSIGLLVRSSEPARTTLSRSAGLRVQGVASTMQFRPLMQILMGTETEVNVSAALEEVATFYDKVAAKVGFPRFSERVIQVHKDHALSLETARQSVLPGARPVDDFSHFDRHALKEVPARCTVTHADAVSGKTLKTHASRIVAFYHEARTLLTLDLFSELWKGMFARMEEDFGEHSVARCLKGTYFKEIAANDLKKEVGMAPAASAGTHYMWSGHWRGALGLFPGTGSGNQATEAFHRPFAAEIDAAGGPCAPAAVLTLLQGLFSRWRTSLEWDSDAALSSLPLATDVSASATAALSLPSPDHCNLRP